MDMKRVNDAGSEVLETLLVRRLPKPDKAATRPALPAGTRVLVQRLVAKPEYNGKRARVLSFDKRGTGRYTVVLDDGRELSLKPECVEHAGCAAAGCTAEEASSACARCGTVRYCSRECQRAHWKAHKPMCELLDQLLADPAGTLRHVEAANLKF